ncbi:MAG: hypothetical protein WCG78_00605 [Candidatus Omnitrophota bacterium]
MIVVKRALPLMLLAVLCSAIPLFASTTATVTVTASVLAGESSIEVDTTSVGFGAVSGSVATRRFHTLAPVKVKYFAGGSAWTVRVYTANPGSVHGLIGVTDATQSIPLKAWCDNYGPRLNVTGHAPDVNNNYFWNGYDFNNNGHKGDTITDGSISEVILGFDVNGNATTTDIGLGTATYPVAEDPVWLQVPDIHDMISNNPYTWRRLTYAGAQLDPTGFPVYFGIDVTGVAPQDYRTTALTFQIINE